MLNEGLGSWPARRARMSPAPHRDQARRGRPSATASCRPGRPRWRTPCGPGRRAGDRVAYLGPNHPAFLETLVRRRRARRGLRAAEHPAGRARAGLHARPTPAPSVLVVGARAAPTSRPGERRPPVRRRTGWAVAEDVRGAARRCGARHRRRPWSPGRLVHDHVHVRDHRAPKGAMLTHGNLTLELLSTCWSTSTSPSDEVDAGERADVPHRRR